MTCNECRKLLLTFPINPPASVGHHLARCRHCARFAKRAARFEKWLVAAARVEVPASIQRGSGEPLLYGSSYRQHRRTRRVRGHNFRGKSPS